MQTLEELDNLFSKNSTLPQNVNFIGNYSDLKSDECRSGRIQWSYKKSGNYRIKWKLGHTTTLIGRYVIAETTNYKRKAENKRWKKTRAYTIAQVYGYISGTDEYGNADCSDENKINFNPNNLYAFDNAKKRIRHKIRVQTKTKSGWVKSFHHGTSGSHNHALTW